MWNLITLSKKKVCDLSEDAQCLNWELNLCTKLFSGANEAAHSFELILESMLAHSSKMLSVYFFLS